jgi:hypothetical protein
MPHSNPGRTYSKSWCCIPSRPDRHSSSTDAIANFLGQPAGRASECLRRKIAHNIECDRASYATLTKMRWIAIRVWDQDVKPDAMRYARRIAMAFTARP